VIRAKMNLFAQRVFLEHENEDRESRCVKYVEFFDIRTSINRTPVKIP
jgi:hypothetical protein